MFYPFQCAFRSRILIAYWPPGVHVCSSLLDAVSLKCHLKQSNPWVTIQGGKELKVSSLVGSDVEERHRPHGSFSTKFCEYFSVLFQSQDGDITCLK